MMCSKFSFIAAIAVMASATVPLSSAGAVTITNGSFEQGIDPGSFTNLVATDSTSITGWTVSSGNIDYIGSYWTAADGSRSLDMNGLAPGAISQVVTGLTIGHQYEVTFELAGNPAGGPDTKTLQLSAGVGTNIYTFDISGHSLASMGWVFEHFVFTADGNSDTLTFASLTTGDSGNSSYPNAFGPALDNVSISQTPLPSTWTMLLLGFIGLGFFAYRGTKKGSAAIAAA
jgi:choice-of-anchor C domain-containing protein